MAGALFKSFESYNARNIFSCVLTTGFWNFSTCMKNFRFFNPCRTESKHLLSLNVGSREKQMIEKLAGVQNINVKFEWYAYRGFRDFKKCKEYAMNQT